MDNDLKNSIADYKLSDQILKGLEEKYYQLFESSPNSIVLLDLKGKIIDCNSSQVKMFGYKKDELIGKDFRKLKLVPKKYEQLAVNSFKNLIKGEILKPRELQILKKDGTLIWIYVQANLVKLNNETLIKIIAQDITALKTTEQKLKESEENYRKLINNLSDVIIEVGMDAKFTYISPQNLHLYGYKPEELIGLSIFKFIHPDDQKIIREKIEDFLKGMVISVDYRIRCKDGHYVPVSARGAIFESSGVKRAILVVRDITKRKRVEDELRLFKAIVETSREAIAVSKPDGQLVYINPAHEKLFGKSLEEAQQINYRIYYPPESIEVLNRVVAPALLKGESWEGILDVYDINGRKFPLWERADSICDENGDMIYGFGLMHDISERKRIEQKLKESEQKYRHLFNSSPHAIWLVNLKGIIVDCNSTMNKLMSIFKREELIGKSFRDVIKLFLSKGDPRFENLEKVFKERFKILLKQGYLDPIEFQISRGDGKTFWITLETSFVKVGNETLLQVFIEDITSRKEAEIKIKKSEEELRILNKELEQKVRERTRALEKSEKKFRYIFEAIPDLFFLVSEDSTILDYHGKEEDFYVPPNVILGKKLSDFLPKALGIKASEMIRKTINTKQPQIMEYSLPVKNKNQYYEARFLFFSKTNVAIFIRNITERKTSEIKLNESRETLKKKNIELRKLDKTKNDFITMAAHELKTPLISISGYTDYILTKYENDLNSEIQQDLLVVKSNIERLQKLMDQFLDAMKIESDKITLHKKLTNVKDIISNCVNNLSYQITEKNQEIRLKIGSNILLKVDHERIFQVFSNILSNAIKFTPKGGKIEISSQTKDKNTYLFEIKDNGIGLSEEEIPRIFKKFEMIQHDSDEYYVKGTGLGLYISKGFIEAHGGKIWVTSDGKNKGTTFTFTLPK